MRFGLLLLVIYGGVPLAVLVAVALSAIALASPNDSDKLKSVALLTITSSTPGGPSVWLGLFSSCAQKNSNLTPICTGLKMHPDYDFSVLPENAPTYVFEGPSIANKRLAWVSITIVGPIFVILALWIPLRGFIVGLQALEPYLLKCPTLAWIGVIVGLTSGLNLWVINLYMETTRQNFNEFVRLQGSGGPGLVAKAGKSLKLGYISNIMLGWPVFIILLETAEAQGRKKLKKS